MKVDTVDLGKKTLEFHENRGLNALTLVGALFFAAMAVVLVSAGALETTRGMFSVALPVVAAPLLAFSSLRSLASGVPALVVSPDRLQIPGKGIDLGWDDLVGARVVDHTGYVGDQVTRSAEFVLTVTPAWCERRRAEGGKVRSDRTIRLPYLNADMPDLMRWLDHQARGRPEGADPAGPEASR